MEEVFGIAAVVGAFHVHIHEGQSMVSGWEEDSRNITHLYIPQIAPQYSVQPVEVFARRQMIKHPGRLAVF